MSHVTFETVTMNIQELRTEWNSLSKNWYSIYQWQRTTGVGYCDWISEWINESADSIELLDAGLRQRPFRIADHQGQISLQTSIAQITEKRIVRAIYNTQELPLLGRIVDYEVSLKETQDASHGDIDLLCDTGEDALCVEAKAPNSGESILKAILQVFTYTMLVSTVRKRFLADFDLPLTHTLTPVVLTYHSSTSGKQLREISSSNQLSVLIETLNRLLEKKQIGPIRFFVVDDQECSFDGSLVEVRESDSDLTRVAFRNGFSWQISEVTAS